VGQSTNNSNNDKNNDNDNNNNNDDDNDNNDNNNNNDNNDNQGGGTLAMTTTMLFPQAPDCSAAWSLPLQSSLQVGSRTMTTLVGSGRSTVPAPPPRWRIFWSISWRILMGNFSF
jgi:hypothetical protein